MKFITYSITGDEAYVAYISLAQSILLTELMEYHWLLLQLLQLLFVLLQLLLLQLLLLLLLLPLPLAQSLVICYFSFCILDPMIEAVFNQLQLDIITVRTQTF